MDRRDVRRLLAASLRDCVCGARLRRLCMDDNNGLPCTREHGHTGLHVACAGSCGPHAIASWGDGRRLEQTMAELEQAAARGQEEHYG